MKFLENCIYIINFHWLFFHKNQTLDIPTHIISHSIKIGYTMNPNRNFNCRLNPIQWYIKGHGSQHIKVTRRHLKTSTIIVISFSCHALCKLPNFEFDNIKIACWLEIRIPKLCVCAYCRWFLLAFHLPKWKSRLNLNFRKI